MATDSLVVITYPYHYHITQLAVINAVKQLGPKNIYILHDTIPNSQRGWGDLGQHIRADLRSHGINAMTIPFEAIESTKTQERGWIRQQYVKLNLHKILDGPAWTVLDGDAILKSLLYPTVACYINPHDVLPDTHRFFTNYALDLGFNDVLFEGKPVSFSAIPFRSIKRDTLEQLEKHIHNLHGKTIEQLYDSFTLHNKTRYLELSEFELLSHFEYQILRKEANLIPIKARFVPTDSFIDHWRSDLDLLVLAGKDNLPRDWYLEQGININDDVWNQLYPK